jgi:ribonuclease HII
MKSVWVRLPALVIAAAVILAPNTMIDGVADSKLLSPRRRQALFTAISEAAIAVAIGQADVDEVDRIKVYWPAMEARRRGSKILPLFRSARRSTGSAESRVVALRKRPS